MSLLIDCSVLVFYGLLVIFSFPHTSFGLLMYMSRSTGSLLFNLAYVSINLSCLLLTCGAFFLNSSHREPSHQMWMHYMFLCGLVMMYPIFVALILYDQLYHVFMGHNLISALLRLILSKEKDNFVSVFSICILLLFYPGNIMFSILIK